MPEATSSMVRCLELLILWLGLLAISSYGAEQPPGSKHLSNAQAMPFEVQGSERRLLARLQHFIKREQWDDALAVADQILSSDSASVVATEPSHYVSLQQYCQRLLANLPSATLEKYRTLVDAPAENWYRRAIQQHDEQLLHRIVDEAFCSSWSDDALDALGQLALKRGEYLSARNYWQAIHPSFVDSPSNTQLTYPDTDLSLADIQARLILVSLREGNLARAKNELEQFKIKYRDAQGKLAGQKVVYAEALQQLLDQAHSWPPARRQVTWPTYAGTASRRNSNPLPSQSDYQQVWSTKLRNRDTGQLNIYPVANNNLLLCQDDSQVYTLHLDSGQFAFTSRGDAFQSSGPLPHSQQHPVHCLMMSKQMVFGSTIQKIEFSRSSGLTTNSLLWGINLQRDGALFFRKESAGYRFLGAPLVVESNLLATISTDDNPTKVGVVCYDLATDQILWQRWICQTRTVAPPDLKQSTNNLLTYDSGTVFCGTNIGAIAAIRLRDGQIRWLKTYSRTSDHTALGNQPADFRLPNPSLYHQGLLYVAPTDSDHLFALQADSGKLLWQRETSSLTGEILGAQQGKLYLSDQGLHVVAGIAGETITSNTQLRLFGQPVITQSIIYWPNYNNIEVLDASSGKILNTIPLAEQGGANLIVTPDYLLAAGRTTITAYRHTPDKIE